MVCSFRVPVVVAVLFALPFPAGRAQDTGVVVDLGGSGADMALDSRRNRVYVSVPSRNEVAILSTDTLSVVERIVVGPMPRGVDLSIDGSTLHVALGGTPALARVDLETLEVERIDVGSAMRAQGTSEVVEGRPGQLLVASDFSTLFFPAIVTVKFDADSVTVEQVSRRILDCDPVFERGPSQRFVYAFTCGTFSPLTKFDLAEEGVPIVLESQGFRGTRRTPLAVHPDGSLLYLGDGKVLDTATFEVVGNVAPGVPRVDDRGERLHVAVAPGTIEVHDPTSLAKIEEFTLPCQLETLRALVVLPDGDGWLVLGDDVVCGRVGERACGSLPSVPSAPSPPDGGRLVLGNEAMVSWRNPGADCPTEYDVYFGPENPPATRIGEAGRVSRIAVGELPVGATFFWQVVARNELGETPGPVWSFTTAPFDLVPRVDLEVQLPAEGADVEYDSVRRLLYVSVPARDEVRAVSPVSLTTARVFEVGPQPAGLSLSLDGNRLFVVLDEVNRIAVVEIDDGSVDEIEVGAAIGEGHAFDVVEARTDQLFVSASPDRNGLPFIVRIRLDALPRVAVRVAGELSFRHETALERDPNGRFLYAVTSSGPEWLHKLDLDLEGAPVVLSNGRELSVGFTTELEVSPDGSRLYTSPGRVLRSADFQQLGVLPRGIHAVGEQGKVIYSPREPNTIEVHDAETFLKTGELTLPCALEAITRLLALPGDGGWVVLGQDRLCGLVEAFPCRTPPPVVTAPVPAQDGRLEVPRLVNLSWEAPELQCPTTFEVYFGAQNPPAERICENLDELRCVVGDLEPGTYFWQVVARNELGETPGPVWSFTTVPHETGPRADFTVPLPAEGADMVHDDGRDRFYVSLPALDEILVISARTLTVLERLRVGPQPRGLDLALDGRRLFAALQGKGAFAVVDLVTGETTEIDVSEALGSNSAFDVVEARPNEVFVSGIPDDRLSLSGIAGVRLDETNIVRRVADERGFRFGPIFEHGPDRRFLYVGESPESPLSPVKLDLDGEDAPVVLVDAFRVADRVDHMEASPDGARLYLGSGLVLRTETFGLAGIAPGGVHQFGEREDIVYIARSPDRIELLDVQTLTTVTEWTAPCEFARARKLVVLPQGRGWAVLGPTVLCGRISEAPCSAAPPRVVAPFPPEGRRVELPEFVTLAWEQPPGDCPVRYDVLFGPESPPTRVLCEDVVETECVAGSLEPGTYYWQVIGRNSFGETASPVWSFTAHSVGVDDPLERAIELGGAGTDMVYDPARELIYVTQPGSGEVAFVSRRSLEVIERVVVGPGPLHVALGIDGRRLFVTLDALRAVAVVDLETREVTRLEVGDAFGNGSAFDVIEARPGRLFVSGHAGRFDRLNIVEIALDQGDQFVPVARQRIIECKPTFELGPDGRFLYVGDCSGSGFDSLYKLDLDGENAPIVLEAAERTLSDTARVAASPDGSRIVLSGGEVLDATTFEVLGNIAAGLPRFGARSDLVHVALPSGKIEVHDLDAFEKVAEIDLPCAVAAPEALVVLPGNEGWILLADDLLCVQTRASDCAGSPPAPAGPAPPSGEDELRADRVVLSWSSLEASCPVSFDVLLGTTDPPTTRLCEGLVEPRCAAEELELDTKYYWRVVATNAAGSTSSPVWSFRTQSCPQRPRAQIRLILDGSVVHEMAHDAGRERIYVSATSADEIIAVSTRTREIVDRIPVGPEPRGIELSENGAELYVALGGASTLVVLDLDTLEAREIDVSEAVAGGLLVDVVQGPSGSVIVSSDGPGHIARVDLAAGEGASRLGGGRNFGCGPILELSPDRRFLYVARCSSAHGIFKLDLGQEGAPVIHERTGADAPRTSALQLSPDGSRIYLSGGKVLRTDTFEQLEEAPRGLHAFGDRDDHVYVGVVGSELDVVVVLDTETGDAVHNFILPCEFERMKQIIILPRDRGWLVLGRDRLCGSLEMPEPDCNESGFPDACDIARGASPDRDGNGVPDECEQPLIRRGDANSDALVDTSDAVFLLSYMFIESVKPPSCEKASDANDDGAVNISDPIVILQQVLLGRPRIAAPFPGCGRDPTTDDLTCDLPAVCNR